MSGSAVFTLSLNDIMIRHNVTTQGFLEETDLLGPHITLSFLPAPLLLQRRISLLNFSSCQQAELEVREESPFQKPDQSYEWSLFYTVRGQASPQ